MDDIVLFSECSLENIEIVGKKAAFLSELYSKGFNIPEGFIITGNLFVKFVELTDIKQQIAEILISNESRERKSLKIQQIILNTPFPEDMAQFIYKNYLRLDENNQENYENKKEPYVSLKVSSTSDYIEDSFFLNIIGKERLINGIKSSWASVFSENNIELKRFKPSIIIQKMVNSIKSGYIYSRNPTNASSNEVLIQVCTGLGNVISLSQTTPSAYIVDKLNGEIVKSDLKDQKIKYELSLEKMRTTKIEEPEPLKNIIDNYLIQELVKVAIKAEERMNDPVRISFALDKSINIVSAKPINVREFQSKFGDHYNFEEIQGTQTTIPNKDSDESDKNINSREVNNYQNVQNQNTDYGHQPKINRDIENSIHKNEEDNQQENDGELLQYYEPELHHNQDLERQKYNSEQNQYQEERNQLSNDYTNDNNYQNQLINNNEFISKENREEKIKNEQHETKESFINKHMPEEPEIYLKKTKFIEQMNIINCDMIITSILRKKYRGLFSKEPPISRDSIINELKMRIQIPYESEIRRIRTLRDEFINNLREPQDYDISFASSIASKLLKEL